MQSRPYSRFSRSSLAIFSHQISITSLTGAGSSTLRKNLLGFLPQAPWRFVSGGMLMRAKAQELGMTIEQFATYNRDHPEKGYDKWLDTTIEELGTHNWVVAEGRLPHIFMPHAYRVRLECSSEVRARRRRDQEFPDLSVEQVMKKIIARDEDDNTRYEKLYPGCMWSDNDFDLIVDTEKMSPGEVAVAVVENHQRDSQFSNKVIYEVRIPE